MKSRQILLTTLAILLIPVSGLLGQPAAKQADESLRWRKLFDGKSLEGWKVANFGGEGDVTVEDGEIRIDFGASLTGVTYTGKVPTSNYEMEFEAKRVDGIDFFCTTTFPVKKAFCSLVVGGWAGSVVGLSSIDGDDASANDTTHYMKFAEGRWYRIRIRVTDETIQAWINDKPVVNQSTVGHKISTRAEVDLSQPLGISAWETRSALRKIRIRELANQAKD
jgi:hypothetical protein